MNEATTLWAWMTAVPGQGVSQVGAMIGDHHTSLITRDRSVAEQMRSLAKQHREMTGQRVWLREYRMATDHGDA